MKVRFALLFSVWLATLVVVLSVPGCYGDNCKGQVQTFGTDPGEGHMISDTEWESNRPDEAWLPFPRQQAYDFNISGLNGQLPELTIPFLSAHRLQSEPGANYVIGAGNIAEIFSNRPNGVSIVNDTCSDYYLRLYVKVAPLPPARGKDVDGGGP